MRLALAPLLVLAVLLETASVIAADPGKPAEKATTAPAIPQKEPAEPAGNPALAGSPTRLVGVPNEPIDIGDFMVSFCEQKGRENRETDPASASVNRQ